MAFALLILSTVVWTDNDFHYTTDVPASRRDKLHAEQGIAGVFALFRYAEYAHLETPLRKIITVEPRALPPHLQFAINSAGETSIRVWHITCIFSRR